MAAKGTRSTPQRAAPVGGCFWCWLDEFRCAAPSGPKNSAEKQWVQHVFFAADHGTKAGPSPAPATALVLEALGGPIARDSREGSHVRHQRRAFGFDPAGILHTFIRPRQLSQSPNTPAGSKSNRRRAGPCHRASDAGPCHSAWLAAPRTALLAKAIHVVHPWLPWWKSKRCALKCGARPGQKPQSHLRAAATSSPQNISPCANAAGKPPPRLTPGPGKRRGTSPKKLGFG